MNASNITRPRLPTFPNRDDVNRTGSIDPEVIVAVDRLVLGGALRGGAGEVSEG